MSTDENKQQVDPKVASREVRAKQVGMLQTMADTTWRMVIPSAIFVCGGIYGDLHWHTKPWLTLFSLVLGLGFSVLLIKQQMDVK